MDNIKLISKAGKIPRTPEDLVLRIQKIKNPTLIQVVEEVEKYRAETKKGRNMVMQRTDFCRLTV